MSTVPAPVLAREVSVWLYEESRARRVAPILEVYPECDYVKLIVCPTTRPGWDEWCELLHVDGSTVEWVRDMVTGRGKCRGVDVFLTAVGIGEWWTP